MLKIWPIWGFLLFCFCGLSQEQNRSMEDLQKLDGFKKFLNKGDIPAVFKPVFVKPDKAEIPDDAWIIGVYDQGEAKAYSINLLNKHEIVNDFIGDKPIATTW